MGLGRTQTISSVLLLCLGAAALSVVVVRASPTCERVVHRYVTVPIRNQVSKATLAAWADWRKNHPDWKPNPKVARPQYKMTQEEIAEKVDFACEVPTDPTPSGLFFTPADFEVPAPPMSEIPAMEMSQLTMPDLMSPVLTDLPTDEATNTPPPFFSSPSGPYGGGGGSNGGGNNGGGGSNPPPPPPLTPVPEPASVVLVATAGVAGWMVRRRINLVG